METADASNCGMDGCGCKNGIGGGIGKRNGIGEKITGWYMVLP